MPHIRELGPEFSRSDSESGFIGRIAFAENDQADIIAKKSVEKRHENLETFFLDHASDHPEDWSARFRCELHLPYQGFATLLLSAKCARVLMGRKQKIAQPVP